MTQPAVSKTIRELEAILDVALFERTRRGVQLTEQGTVFRRHVDAVLNALRPLGVTAFDGAATPNRVWRLIHKGHAGE